MTTIDLAPPPAPEPGNALAALPRRVALTLPELRTVAAHAGDAPLPFEPAEPRRDDPLEGRLGASRGTSDADAFAAAVASLRDPVESLTRRGLLVDGAVDPGLLGAVGLLAAPAVALDLDLVVGTTRAKSWQRQAAGAVATLGTVDGVVFELAWYDVAHWPAELARVAVPPEGEAEAAGSGVPADLEAPYELVDAVGEALRGHRADLVPALVGEHGGRVRAEGRPLGEPAAAEALTALHTEGRGRLRALVTRVDEDAPAPVGVVSWVLLGDGWRSLQPRDDSGGPAVRVLRREPGDLAADLAPVLAEVSA